jgi:hypothetical protein
MRGIPLAWMPEPVAMSDDSALGGAGLWEGEDEGDVEVVVVEEGSSAKSGNCRLGARVQGPDDAASQSLGWPATASHLSMAAAGSDALLCDWRASCESLLQKWVNVISD